MQSLSKFQWHFFAEIEELILKFLWDLKDPRIAKTIWKMKNKIEELIRHEFETYYKTTVIKILF